MDKLRMQTANKADENFRALAAMFPNAVTETIDENGEVVRAIDKDVLMQEISVKVVEGKDERYQFTWPDKKKAVLLANAPISKTLRPCREESVDFDTTENLYIEGDNLEVLKLLQETYLGKIKVIYIDPPYNTGNDFVYEDNFASDANEYLSISGQYDILGNRLVVNTESNGRFHTDWLNMIYPRLRLAKDLLKNDGVIFVSIDDNELDNLLKVMNEVFGEEQYIATFKWNRVKKAPSLSGSVRTKYEYVVAYYKQERTMLYGKASYNKQGPLWHLPNRKQTLLFPPKSIRVKKDFAKGEYGGTYQVDLLDDLICENGLNRDAVRIAACSAWGQEKINSYVAAGNTFEIKKEPTTVYTDLQSENNFIAPSDLINDEECGVKTNTDANEDMKKMGIAFDYTKPISLIEYLLKMGVYNDPNALVLDFFSGSATTAHAVMQLNAKDGGNRRFIMVQVPEETGVETESYKAGFSTICKIGKERIRRASKKIKEQLGAESKKYDFGFRVLKCDTSNMKDVFYRPDEVEQNLFDNYSNNIKEDRTPEDLLFQVMLDLGVLLSSKIEATTIIGCKVFNVAEGFLYACFDNNISDEVVKAIANEQPYYAVFRDSGMASDSVLTNFDQIFASISPTTVRKVL